MGSRDSASISDRDFKVIWNRAGRAGLATAPEYDGDAALHLVLTFHRKVVARGLLGTLDTYEDDLNYPLPWVLQAYRALSLHISATVIEQAFYDHYGLLIAAQYDDSHGISSDKGTARWDRAQARIDATYTLTDAAIARATRALIAQAPEDFAPPR